ncbi:MAG: hypothetical protein NTZ53_00920 [Cyanobacteria bacterium]|nr:hypothetical protein [Cyanobacteriota bacterium]
MQLSDGINIYPGATFLASTDGSKGFAGGTLIVDAPSTFTRPYALDDFPANTIDVNGQIATCQGALMDASSNGAIAFTGTGGGKLIVAGNNTYTGSRTIKSDNSAWVNVAVNGNISSSSDLAVQYGSILGGVGLLPSTTVVAGAFHSPGNSIGHETVSGNYSLTSGGLILKFQGPQNDKTSVTGNVTAFTGTANLLPRAGGSPWPDFDYQIVAATNDFAGSSNLSIV